MDEDRHFLNPRSTWYNHFSHDGILDYYGENGFPMLCVVHRGRISKNVPSNFVHKVKVAPHDRKSKVARTLQPITMVNTCKIGEVTFPKARLTFQKTGATNLQYVNSLNANKRFVKKK